MRVLVDAQLPRRLSVWLRDEGVDAVHTRDLPEANRTSDAAINQLSLEEQRVVITKDSDFVDSLLLQGAPYKLLLVATGNIGNAELEQLLRANWAVLAEGFERFDYIEIDQTTVRFHF